METDPSPLDEPKPGQAKLAEPPTGEATAGSEAELRELIERWLPEYGYRPTEEAAERLARYLGLVASYNHKVRLVGDTSPERLVRRHLGESLFLGEGCDLEALRAAGEGLLDVGSGGGFPGLALAAASPGLKTTLVEATAKKARFLAATAAALGLGAEVQVRTEFLPRRPLPPEGVFEGLVTVRALEHMERVPAWLGHWLAPGARAAFWVTDPVVERWRRQYLNWHWEPALPIPSSEQRVILLGRPG